MCVCVCVLVFMLYNLYSHFFRFNFKAASCSKQNKRWEEKWEREMGKSSWKMINKHKNEFNNTISHICYNKSALEPSYTHARIRIYKQCKNAGDTILYSFFFYFYKSIFILLSHFYAIHSVFTFGLLYNSCCFISRVFIRYTVKYGYQHVRAIFVHSILN